MPKSLEAALAALELDVDHPCRIVLLHPGTSLPLKDKAGKEAYIDVISGDSGIAEKYRKEIRSARLRTRNPNKIDLDKENRDLLAALSTDWYLVDLNGEPIDLPFSRENAAALYASNRAAWITDQVDSGAGDRANFLKGSSTT